MYRRRLATYQPHRSGRRSRRSSRVIEAQPGSGPSVHGYYCVFHTDKWNPCWFRCIPFHGQYRWQYVQVANVEGIGPCVRCWGSETSFRRNDEPRVVLRIHDTPFFDFRRVSEPLPPLVWLKGRVPWYVLLPPPADNLLMVRRNNLVYQCATSDEAGAIYDAITYFRMYDAERKKAQPRTFVELMKTEHIRIEEFARVSKDGNLFIMDRSAGDQAAFTSVAVVVKQASPDPDEVHFFCATPEFGVELIALSEFLLLERYKGFDYIAMRELNIDASEAGLGAYVLQLASIQCQVIVMILESSITSPYVTTQEQEYKKS